MFLQIISGQSKSFRMRLEQFNGFQKFLERRKFSLNCSNTFQMLLKYSKKVLKHYRNSKMLLKQSKVFDNSLDASKSC